MIQWVSIAGPSIWPTSTVCVTGIYVPVGGRWVVAFWSPKPLDGRFTQQARGLPYMAASAAAVRLEQLVGYEGRRIESRGHLTPREQSVIAACFAGTVVGRDREVTRPRSRNGPQPLEKSTSKARDPQSHTYRRGGDARLADYLSMRRALRVDHALGALLITSLRTPLRAGGDELVRPAHLYWIDNCQYRFYASW